MKKNGSGKRGGGLQVGLLGWGSWAAVVSLFFVQKHFPFLFLFADLIFNQHFKHSNHSNNSNYCNEFLVLFSSITNFQNKIIF